MIDPARFNVMKEKHGQYGSWAVWAPMSGAPKSNMGDLQVLDEHANPDLLATLKPGIVMIGLNISRGGFAEPFRNFHDASAVANDFKIRYAFHDTEFWGAYMTDVLKGFEEPLSGKVLTHLATHPGIVRDHMEILRDELRDLGHPRPVILAFGGAAHSLLKPHLRADEYSLLVRLTHYSHRVSKEKYRADVHRQIALAHAAERSSGSTVPRH